MTPSPLLLTRLALRNSRYNSSIRTLHGASTTPFNLNLLGAMTKTAKPTHIIGNSALETQTRSAEVAVEWRKEAEWKEGGVQPAHHANDSASRFQNPWPSFRCVLPLPLTRCTAIDVEHWDVRPLPASRWLRVSTFVFFPDVACTEGAESFSVLFSSSRHLPSPCHRYQTICRRKYPRRCRIGERGTRRTA